MNIETLQLFIAIAEKNSISKASLSKNISQSAISQQLKKIETNLGVKLFERTSKGVTLTKYGKVLYDQSISICNSYSTMIKTIENMKNESKILRIVATPTIYSYALPCTIYDVKKKHPNFALEVDSSTNAKIEEIIENNLSDIGFIVDKPKCKNLVSKKIFSDKAFLVCSNNLDIPKTLKISDIYNYPLLMLSKNQTSRIILDKYLISLGIDINKLKILYELDSTESLKLSALNSYGLVFIPYMAIKKELYNNLLKTVKLESFDFEYSYYSVKQKNNGQIDGDLNKVIRYIEKNYARYYLLISPDLC